MKVYCETNAMYPSVRGILRRARIELVHFPHDRHSRSDHVDVMATPSRAQIRDLNCRIKDLPGKINDYSGSFHLEAILTIIGRNNRRDALHVDSAYKTGCAAFVTKDSDILDHAVELQSLLGIRFFHPANDFSALQAFISCNDGAT
jgi:myo-inositol catabolism protein IolC